MTPIEWNGQRPGKTKMPVQEFPAEDRAVQFNDGADTEAC